MHPLLRDSLLAARPPIRVAAGGAEVCVVHLATTPSTNDAAAALADERPGTPLVVTAETQSASRGRLGRTWASPPGGLWMSLAWPSPTSRVHLSELATAPLLAGLAIAEAVDRELSRAARGDRPPTAMLRWPNDVLLTGRKVAGVLCERRVRADGGTGATGPRASGAGGGAGGAPIIIGLGVNVNNDTGAMTRAATSAMRTPPVALCEVARAWLSVESLRDAVLDALLPRLRRLSAGASGGLSAEDRAAIGDRLADVGATVEVRDSASPAAGPVRARGRVMGVDASGRLMLRTPTGDVTLESGELSVRPAHD